MSRADRTETSRALARALAYRDAGNARAAEAAAFELLALLVLLGILPPGMTIDTGAR